MEEKVTHDGWGWLKDSEWSAKQTTKPDKAQPAPSPEAAGGWSIQVASLEGRDRQRKAQTLAKQVRQYSRMPQVWVEEDKSQARVLAGRYRSPDDWGAMEDLNHLRFVEVNGEHLFAAAELIPLGDDTPGASSSDHDLKRYIGMFSLQIGFYDDTVGPEFRKAAENAVRILREQGEQAYFYHGPHRSLICLGLFTENDFSEEGGTRAYGPRIKELQGKYPYNLANGYTQVEKQQGQVIGEQPSFLVRIF